jgi:hypothetical protein
MRYKFGENFLFCWPYGPRVSGPSGKPMTAYLLRCQGLAVNDYSFALGRLAAGLPSTFDQLG